MTAADDRGSAVIIAPQVESAAVDRDLTRVLAVVRADRGTRLVGIAGIMIQIDRELTACL